MTGSYALGLTVLGVVITAAATQGETAAHYRDFQLGGSLASVSAITGAPASDVKTIHTRPASLQSLEWRRPYAGSSGTAVDPVQQIAFSFYNDQLFRLVVDYDRNRTEGMTDGDMIEAITGMYGSTVKAPLKATSPSASIDEESGTRVAGWGDGEYTAVLYRSSYASGFRMIVTSVRLSALARTAAGEAVRLDERDAPQRERDRQKKQADDDRAAKAKARAANKAGFTP